MGWSLSLVMALTVALTWFHNSSTHRVTVYSEQAEMLNLGWRFDYQLLTPGMRRIVRNAKLPRQPRFSQHAPLIVDYDWLLSV